MITVISKRNYCILSIFCRYFCCILYFCYILTNLPFPKYCRVTSSWWGGVPGTDEWKMHFFLHISLHIIYFPEGSQRHESHLSCSTEKGGGRWEEKVEGGGGGGRRMRMRRIIIYFITRKNLALTISLLTAIWTVTKGYPATKNEFPYWTGADVHGDFDEPFDEPVLWFY